MNPTPPAAPPVHTFLDSTEVVADGAEMRERLSRDGYVFLRGLLPTEPLRALRLEFLRIAQEAGWLQAGSALEQGEVAPSACDENDPRLQQYTDSVFRMESAEALHQLPHQPVLMRLFERILGAPVLLHPRLVVRAILPNCAPLLTQPHQDHTSIGGTPDIHTLWVPLSDCPVELGSLQVAAGSHHHGVLPVRPSRGIGRAEVIDPLEGTWTGGDFQLGDVLIFHGLTVHRAAPNLTGRLRLSIDFRYQRLDAPIHPRCFLMGEGPRSWEALYSGWKSSQARYYWHKLPLRLEPSVATLQRVVATHPAPDKVHAARMLLAAVGAA